MWGLGFTHRFKANPKYYKHLLLVAYIYKCVKYFFSGEARRNNERGDDPGGHAGREHMGLFSIPNGNFPSMGGRKQHNIMVPHYYQL